MTRFAEPDPRRSPRAAGGATTPAAAPAGAGGPPDFWRLAALLLGVRGRALVAQTFGLRHQSRLMLAVLGGFIAGYLVAAYAVAFYGMRYLLKFPLVGALLSQRMVFLVFGFVFVMLVFSNLVVGFATLFKNRETEWLLTLPVAHRDVYRWKVLESLALSSWALLFLAAPIVVAFGQANHVPPLFYAKVALLFLAFVIPPGLAGSWGILGLAGLFGNPWFKRALVALAVAAAVATVGAVRPTTAEDATTLEGTLSFDRLMRHTRPSLSPLLPSAWAARSFLAWADDLPGPGWFYCALLAANAALALIVGSDVVSRCFYSRWNAAATAHANRTTRATGAAGVAGVPRWAAGRRRPDGDGLLDAVVARIRWLSPQFRALALKDLRLFWRDPVQWTQFMVFFGLLAIYVLNLRHVAFNMQNPFWEMVVSHLNLAASALTLSTLTTRFVFPQFSLEGRRLWVIGLAPIGMGRVLWQKFVFAYVATAGVTAALLAASGAMLGLGVARIGYFLFGMVLLAAGLCGLAVGLGVLFPNLREDNPSKIVSGFGGTLCLVISFLYVTASVACLAVPGAKPFIAALAPIPDAAAVGAATALAALTGGLPMWLALRRSASFEV